MSVEFPHATPWHPSQLRDRTTQEQFARLAAEGNLPQGRYSEEADLEAGWEAYWQNERDGEYARLRERFGKRRRKS